MKRKIAIILTCLCAFLVVSCAQQTSQSQSSQISLDEAITSSSGYYLSQAQQQQGQDRDTWLLLGIKALLKENNLSQANTVLSQLSPNLSPVQQLEKQFLSVEIAYLNHDDDDAIAVLETVVPDGLTESNKIRYYDWQTKLYDTQPLIQLRAYVQLVKLGNDKFKHNVINRVWTTLTSLSREQLNSFVINTNEVTLQGWLDLVRAKLENENDISQFELAVREWQTQYPTNPAAIYLPRQVFAPAYVLPDVDMAKMAVLLPLSGPQAPFGQAILTGIKQAVFASQEPVVNRYGDLMSLVWDKDTDRYLNVFDTYKMSVEKAMQAAVDANDTVVIGPLLKNDVESIMHHALPLPVLALNKPEGMATNPNLCYFSLSPEQEAVDAADHLAGQGKQQPLLLVPDGVLGKRIANAFALEWSTKQRQPALVQYLPPLESLRVLMNSGVDIKMDGDAILVQPPTINANNTQAQNMDSMISPLTNDGLPISAVEPEAKHIDAIYIVANQDELMVIKPMLDRQPNNKLKDSSVVDAKNIPDIYLSSRSHRADQEQDFKLEMNGVQFSDIALLAGNDNHALMSIPEYIRDDYFLTRLYAMGWDSWHLANDFKKSSLGIGYQFKGKTGVISVGTSCVINRQSLWQEYKDGNIVPVSNTQPQN